MVAAAFLPSVSENRIWRKFTSLHKKVHLISKPMRSGESVSWWTEVHATSTPDESLKNHLIIWRTACTSPSKSASTRPSWVLRTQPRKPNSSAWRRTRSRKVVSCTTLPEIKACERKRCACSSLVSSRSPQQSSVWARNWSKPLFETSRTSSLRTSSLGGIVAPTLWSRWCCVAERTLTQHSLSRSLDSSFRALQNLLKGGANFLQPLL